MKVIIDSVGVDIVTGVRCVLDCVSSKQYDCIWTFTEKSTMQRIVVYDRKNKNSTTYKVYYDKEAEKRLEELQIGGII